MYGFNNSISISFILYLMIYGSRHLILQEADMCTCTVNLHICRKGKGHKSGQTIDESDAMTTYSYV